MANTFDSLRRQATFSLREHGIKNADIDVRILLGFAAGYSDADLIAQRNAQISPSVLEIFNRYLERRMAHEPIAYITQQKKFFSLSFHVNSHVLIPRPETEGLVEHALTLISDTKSPKILDVGTGSGAILISLLHDRKDASGLGVDIYEPALDIAKKNAHSLGVNEQCKFIYSDYLQKVTDCYDLLVSNPPYITDKAMQELDGTVKSYEPHLALRGGADGLSPYRNILRAAPAVLKARGCLVFEIGYDQGQTVSNLVEQAGFKDVKIIQDLAGHDRIISAKKQE